jgi:MoaA/NifB/PqqE/SkfB family radical SAM enzyme
LIYPHLLTSLDYAHQKGIFTAITTNGLKLKDLAGELSISGLKSLNVSLDGPPETHNMIRGNPHSFELAFEGIKQVLELSQNKIKVSVYYTITEWN